MNILRGVLPNVRTGLLNLRSSAAVFSGLSAAAAVLLVWVLLGLDSARLHVPLNYGGDANLFLAIAKNILNGNSWWHSAQLGAPFSADWRDFPHTLAFDYSVLRVLALLVKEPGLLLNLYWLATVAAMAGFATYTFSRLGIDRWVSASIGVVYALQPFTWIRNIAHFSTLSYWVPLLAGLLIVFTAHAIETAAAPFEASPRTNPDHLQLPVLSLCVAAFCQGLSNPYNAFFFGCFLVFSGLLLLCITKRIAPLRSVLLVLAALTAGFLINFSGPLAYRFQHGENPVIPQRSAAEAEWYGLKLRHLVIPFPHHPLPPFSELSMKFKRVGFPLENENATSRLGTLGTVGFLGLLAVCMFRTVTGRSPTGNAIGVLAVFTLFGFLVGTIGGLGAIFNTLVSPQIRCYNRIVTFVEYFALAAVGIWLTKLQSRWTARGVVPLWAVRLGLGIMCVAAVLDHTTYRHVRAGMHERTFHGDEAFVKILESRFGGNAAIFQLPHADFPYDNAVRLAAFAHAMPYLHSNSIRWSWGAMPGRTPDWSKRVAKLAPDLVVGELQAKGFAGIWVDISGYGNVASSPVAGLSSALGVPPLVSDDGRFYVFDIRPGASGIAAPESSAVEPRSASRPWTKSMSGAVLTRLTEAILGRLPTDKESTSWSQEARPGSATTGKLLGSLYERSEFMETGLFVAWGYRAILGREPDYEGWAFWTDHTRRFGSQGRLAMIRNMLDSQEHRERFGTVAVESRLSSIFRNVAGSDPEGRILASWQRGIKLKRASPDEILLAMSQLPEVITATKRCAMGHLVFFTLASRQPSREDLAHCAPYWSADPQQGRYYECVSKQLIPE